MLSTLALLALAVPRAEAAPRVDRILVLKSARKMLLLSAGRTVKSYRISLGRNPVGDKVRRGDGRTPEGKYIIKNRNSRSSFHRSLRISYPDPRDMMEARRRGVHPGGNIMIHGLPNGHGPSWAKKRLTDWTAGCIAVTDREIREIWHLVADGTPIEIRP